MYSCTKRLPVVSHLLTHEQCDKNLCSVQTHIIEQRQSSMTARVQRPQHTLGNQVQLAEICYLEGSAVVYIE